MLTGMFFAAWIWLKKYIGSVKRAEKDSSSPIIEKPDKISLLAIGLVVLWQCIYFIIKIPRLGPVNDIDLFFSVYITLAFATGLLFENILQNHFPEKLNQWRNVIFSIYIGNTAITILFLVFRGVPASI